MKKVDLKKVDLCPGVNSVTFKSLERFKVLTKYYAGSFKGREGVATFVGS